MTLTIKSYVTGLAILLLGLLFWKNSKSYGKRSRFWRLCKSLVDLALILGCALRLPALLVAWCVLWFTRSFKNPALRTTMAVLAGIAFGIAGATAIEVLILCGIFAVDLVTGAQGFILHLHRVEQDDRKRQRPIGESAA